MRKLNKRAAHILHPDSVMIVSAHTHINRKEIRKRESNKDKMQSSCAVLS
jgi:hypothetical protein